MAAEKQRLSLHSEHVLVQRARDGDGRAFDALFRAHREGVFACLWCLLDGEPDAVEDAVGAVFLSAFRGLPAFRMDSSFATWLYRIATNEARARVRLEKRERIRSTLSLDDHCAAGGITPVAPDPTERVLREEAERVLLRAVRALPEPYRTPTVLRYLVGLDSHGISEALHRPRGTIRFQLSRAMQILRERLGSSWLE